MEKFVAHLSWLVDKSQMLDWQTSSWKFVFLYKGNRIARQSIDVSSLNWTREDVSLRGFGTSRRNISRRILRHCSFAKMEVNLGHLKSLQHSNCVVHLRRAFEVCQKVSNGKSVHQRLRFQSLEHVSDKNIYRNRVKRSCNTCRRIFYRREKFDSMVLYLGLFVLSR